MKGYNVNVLFSNGNPDENKILSLHDDKREIFDLLGKMYQRTLNEITVQAPVRALAFTGYIDDDNAFRYVDSIFDETFGESNWEADADGSGGYHVSVDVEGWEEIKVVAALWSATVNHLNLYIHFENGLDSDGDMFHIIDEQEELENYLSRHNYSTYADYYKSLKEIKVGPEEHFQDKILYAFLPTHLLIKYRPMLEKIIPIRLTNAKRIGAKLYIEYDISKISDGQTMKIIDDMLNRNIKHFKIKFPMDGGRIGWRAYDMFQDLPALIQQLNNDSNDKA